MAKGIEFVKHYKAHLGKFTGLAVSADGLRLCTTSDDQVSCGRGGNAVKHLLDFTCRSWFACCLRLRRR